MATDSPPAPSSIASSTGAAPEAIPLFLLDSTAPLQEAPFSMEHLEAHARALAARHAVVPTHPKQAELWKRFEENRKALEADYDEIVAAVGAEEEITPGAEWLLDNFYVVREQLSEICEDLPRQFYHELPKLASGVLAGYPRVYALALEIIAHTDSTLDEATLTRFIKAYQEITPLGMGEVWAVPIMLRLGLVENLRRLADSIVETQYHRRCGEAWADEIIEQRPDDPAGVLAKRTEQSPKLAPPLVAHLDQRFRDQGHDLSACWLWLHQDCQQRGGSIDDIVRQEHQRQAHAQVSTGNAITSMRLISALDWTAFFEESSLVERELRRDPAGIYAEMDFATRDRYRHVVENLARRARLPEVEVAQRLLVEAFGPTKESSSKSASKPPVKPQAAAQDLPPNAPHVLPNIPPQRHIGYYLIDDGRAAFETALGLNRSLLGKLRVAQSRRPGLAYFGSLLAVWLAAIAVIEALSGWGNPAAILIAVAALVCIPASEVAVSIINYLTSLRLSPRVLPKMEFKEGIPPSARTIVVVPSLLLSQDGLRGLLQRLEIHFLANPDPELDFALLTDFVDAKEREMPDDERLLASAVEGIRELNRRYGDGGKTRFWLFHRARRWNPLEKKWMGWERKRGKISEFNRLLRGATDTSYTVPQRVPSELAGIQFVITLDADTQLPLGTARRLISTITHPLNLPQRGERPGQIERGYTILQPRIGISPVSANQSLFARTYSGNPHIDPYITAVSDVYQDAFGEGSFTGKGIYDLDAFEAATESAFPENHILSHDLIEGCVARSALVSDAELIDSMPAQYYAYARRQHRWVRGDWQLLRWLFPRVPTVDGKRRNPLNLVSWWKIFDNLRRSAVAPSLLVLLAVGWLAFPGRAWLWSLVAVVVLAMPLVIQLGSVLLHWRRAASWRQELRELQAQLGLAAFQAVCAVCFLPHQAYLMSDAIIRTVVRVLITHRNLLEWESAAVTEQKTRDTWQFYLRNMWFAPLTGIALLLGIALREGTAVFWSGAFWSAAPLALLWIASPWSAWRLSRPFRHEPLPLDDNERRELRLAARRTWLFFETFVGADGNWLPPDNFQESPKPEVAYRTSPTNEGLLLVSALAAHDFGYLGAYDLLGWLERSLDSWTKLVHYRGHPYNWYDTKTLEPLHPAYISTVDSGNLAACALTVRQGLLAMPREPLLSRSKLAGLRDMLALVPETIRADVAAASSDKASNDKASNDKASSDKASSEKAASEKAASEKAAKDNLARLESCSRQVEMLAERVADLEAVAPSDPRGWQTMLSELEHALAPVLAACGEAALGEAAINDAAAGAGKNRDSRILPPPALANRAAALSTQVTQLRRDFDALFPWLHQLERLAKPRDSHAERQDLLPALNVEPTLESVVQLPQKSAALFSALRNAVGTATSAGGDPAAQRALLDALEASVAAGATAAQAIIDRCSKLSDRLQSVALNMDFTFLYDRSRRLFSIGYNLSTNQLDRSRYDLLASEARLASFLAIGKGEVDYRHWFHLGRPLTNTAGLTGLLSWGGTMFEYMMPCLFLRTYPETLLAQSCEAAVQRQIQFGRQQRLPWGVSESAFAALDTGLTYQYQSFGVPGLGLKRGLAEDHVVAPYATALALPVQPREGMLNFRALATEGALGNWGFYESIDYTPRRLPPDGTKIVVQCYFAHHQGMLLAALANCLLDNCMPRRFHCEPMTRAADLLLQERVPAAISLIEPHEDEVDQPPVVRQADRPLTRWLTTPHTYSPRAHLLSNGEYTVMLTNAGGGFSMAGDTRITRWRPDTICDPWGQFIYLRDLDRRMLWSAGYQPVARQPDEYEVLFSVDKAEFNRRDGDWETHSEIAIAPDKNVEVRLLLITNHGEQARTIDATSFAELVLCSADADLAHPAFQKLFVETEWLPEHHALLAHRRPRTRSEQAGWALHTLAIDENARNFSTDEIQFETDRARFLGRGRTAALPAACAAGGTLSGTVGPVIDPIFSLRKTMRIPAGKSVRLAFCTGLAKTRDEALALADQFHDLRVVSQAFDLAWAHAQVELRHIHLSANKIHLFQRLASLLLYPDASRRADREILTANRQGQSALWRYGISGDYPIVLARITSPDQDGLVRDLFLAHQNWRSKGFNVELVFLNEQPTGYFDAVQDRLHRLLGESRGWDLLNKRGGVFILQGARIPAEDRILLQAAAGVMLQGEAGSLDKQLDLPASTLKFPPPMNFDRGKRERSAEHEANGKPNGRSLTTQANVAPNAPPNAAAPSSAAGVDGRFANGFGEFADGGREYVVRLDGERWTPAPWSNVIANDKFGCMLSETGCGCTWSENSRENKLTGWSNDPVSDPPSEAIYICDCESGERWTPTPLPIREPQPYIVRHGQGYTQFEHDSHGIRQRLLITIGADAPVKIFRLSLRNDSRRPRRLSITACVEWVLGVDRQQTQLHIVTSRDEKTGAILASNAFNADFSARLAFFHLIGRTGTISADRREFFGRNGNWSNPAALGRVGLSGRVGPELDPCGAIQTYVDIAPGEEQEVVFLLGQVADRDELAALLDRYSDSTSIAGSIAETKKGWDDFLTAIQVNTPNAALNVLLNRWLLYQTLSCRFWGRTAFYQSGGAYGYRDQLQDSMALVYGRPDLAREHLLRCAARQFEEGDVQHWWHPPTGRGVRTRFCDDLLWLPLVACHYVATTGDRSVLEEVATYLHSAPLAEGEQERYEQPEVSPQSDSLYAHCLRAIDHAARDGAHGLPLMGTGDWNDGMSEIGVGGKGESVWAAWFQVQVLERFANIAETRGDSARAAALRNRSTALRGAAESTAWDGAWYRRAYFDDGTPLGSQENDACQIDSIAQSWSVFAGADPARSSQAMQSLWQRLVRVDDKLALLLWPPFDHTALDPGYIKGYLPGVRENGGQYTHAALWAVQAWAEIGDGDRAHQLFDLLMPIRHADDSAGVEKYRVEPYVAAADVYSLAPHTGRGGWTWYTGSAAWMYRVGLESLLGFKLEGDRLRIEPCLPKDWPGFEITLRRGNANYRIVVENPCGVSTGVRMVTLDGQRCADGSVSLSADGKEHRIEITMGPRDQLPPSVETRKDQRGQQARI